MPKKAGEEKTGATVMNSSDNDGCLFKVTVSLLPANVPAPPDAEKSSKFLDGVLDGALKGAQPEDVQKADVTVGTIAGKQASYNGYFPGTEVKVQAVKRIILVDRNFYIFDFWIMDEEYAGAAADQEKFFNSITIAE